MRWVSIDPGDIHVGFALWQDTQCLWAIEMNPSGTIEYLQDTVPKPGIVVCERFLLYGWAAAQQMGSEFKTSQLIGAIKLLCQQREMKYVGQLASQGKATYNRKPWAIWKARDWRAYGHGGHAKDAEAHGYNFLWDQGWRPGLEGFVLQPT